MNAQPRKPTNLSLDSALLSEAKALKMNLSRAAEEGVRRAVAAAKAAPSPAKRLNPIFDINGQPMVMLAQFMAAVPIGILKPAVTNLDAEFDHITRAIDMLTQGF